MCQNVFGMVWYSDWILWDCDDSDYSDVKFSDISSPLGRLLNGVYKDVKLYYCVYEPQPGEKEIENDYLA